MAGGNLDLAKKNKKDEFYTQRSDIENELKHYKEHFKNKVVYCNCDDPEWSNFYFFFQEQFENYQLKKLITTHYEPNGKSYKLEILSDINGKKVKPYPVKTDLKGSGDFRDQECIELLKEADIVVTNPPFSLFREYVSQLIEYNKKFLIIGNVNSITYKEIFKLIKENKIWLGPSISSGDREFAVPDYYEIKSSGFRIDENGKKYIRVKGVRWFTNLNHKKRNEELILYEKYDPKKYPKYDNYDAINVNKTNEIPCDYDGEMGVPITFLDKYNPDQFEIIDINPHFFSLIEKGLPKIKQLTLKLVGEKDPYARILIKNKKVGK